MTRVAATLPIEWSALIVVLNDQPQDFQIDAGLGYCGTCDAKAIDRGGRRAVVFMADVAILLRNFLSPFSRHPGPLEPKLGRGGHWLWVGF